MEVVALARKLRAHIPFAAYVKSKFLTYSQDLLSEGFSPEYINKYKAMLKNVDTKVLLSSIHTLFSSDYTDQLCKIDGKKLLVVNSINESDFLRKESEYIRRHILFEHSMYIHGKHEDIAIHPNKEYLKSIVRFLIK